MRVKLSLFLILGLCCFVNFKSLAKASAISEPDTISPVAQTHESDSNNHTKRETSKSDRSRFPVNLRVAKNFRGGLSKSEGPVFQGNSKSYYKPSVVSYKPGTGAGTLPPIVFPPVDVTTAGSVVTPGGSFYEEVQPPTAGGYGGGSGVDGGTVPIITPGESGGTPGVIGPPGGNLGTGGGVGGFPGVPGSTGTATGSGTEDDLLVGIIGLDRDGGQVDEENLSRRTLALKGSNRVRTRTRTRVLQPTTTTQPTSMVGRSRNFGNNRVRMRMRDKVRESLEEGMLDDAVVVEDDDVVTEFVFSDIKCYRNRGREYFGASIHMKSGFHAPYIRDRPQDPLTSSQCRMEALAGSQTVYHLTVSDLSGCGVEQCGDHYCLTMVFPRVPTLALADDEVTTIKCLPQKSTMADTRTVTFAGDTLENRKASSTVEGGGQDFAAEVGVFRQNPGTSNGLFVKRVNSGGIVQLGEPLQLRSIVRGGDGWRHSKLSDVKVWRMSGMAAGNLNQLDPKDATEVITLVDEDGCRNEEYMVIAEKDPVKDPRNDLINHFSFKAFLFRGQRANEPLVLTAKVHACQEDIDCNPRSCSVRRVKRTPVEIHNASRIVHDWSTGLAIRVMGLKDHPSSISQEDLAKEHDFIEQDASAEGRAFSNDMSCGEKMATVALISALAVLLLGGVSIALYVYGKKDRGTNNPGKCHIAPNGSKRPVPFPRSNLNFNFPPSQFQPPQPRITKPLPPTPSPRETPENYPMGNTKSVANCDKMLRKKGKKGEEEDGTEYECIDETSSNSSREEKKDGVYIVYIDRKKNNRGSRRSTRHRPKSAPPVEGSHRRSSRRYLRDASDNQDSTEESDGWDGRRKAPPQASRRTPRTVKTRSAQHKKVVAGIRRRLSSIYWRESGGKDGKRAGIGSFPSRHKGSCVGSSDLDSAYCGSELNDDLLDEMRHLARTHRQKSASRHSLNVPENSSHGHKKQGSFWRENPDNRMSLRNISNDVKPKNYSNNAIWQEKIQRRAGLKNELIIQNEGNLRNSSVWNVANKESGGNYEPSIENGEKLKNSSIWRENFESRDRQIAQAADAISEHVLKPGETKAAHFVTRHENSTQILIVPETHV